MTWRGVAWAIGACAALFALGGAVAGFRTREPECVRIEPARQLNLNLASDRTHLRADLDDIRAVAAAFSHEVSRRPRISDSIDAQEGARTAPVRALAWCEAILQQQLTTTHGMPLEAVLDRKPAAADQTSEDQSDVQPARVTDPPAASIASRSPR